MKTAKNLLLILGTLAVLVLGLFLPNVVSAVQNVQTDRQQFAVDTVYLEAIQPQPVSELLRLVQGGYYSFAAEEGKRLNSDRGRAAADAALEELSKFGIETAALTYYESTPLLLISDSGEKSAIIWKCTLAAPGNVRTISMHLDDETGKMLAFQYNEMPDSAWMEEPKDATEPTEPPELSMGSWIKFCAQYYDITPIENHIDDPWYSVLYFIDSDGDSLSMPLSIEVFSNFDGGGTYINFNYYEMYID